MGTDAPGGVVVQEKRKREKERERERERERYIAAVPGGIGLIGHQKLGDNGDY